MFILAVLISFVTTLITTAYGPILGKYIREKTKNRVILGINYLISYLLKLYAMLLMMTMNAVVCLAIASAMALGSTFFSVCADKRRKSFFKSRIG